MLDSLSAYFGDSPFYPIEVPSDEVSMQDAVTTYLFNTQLVDIGAGKMAIVAPIECKENANTHRYLDKLIGLDNPVQEVIYRDLRQSMRNGGGPACLRLRVVMNEAEAKGVNQGSIMTDQLFGRLNTWVDSHYRDQVAPADLADVAFLHENRRALDELTQILQIGSIYPFQKG
jgi:succinylarginine dihydrolase